MGINSKSSTQSIEIRKKKNREEMKNQVITFVLMIFFTLIAFALVGYGEFSGYFILPILTILAIVQVIFQLYYFMHMKDKGHEAPALFMYSGMFVALLTVATMMLIVWW